MTALHHAVDHGHLATVRALIRAGASLDIQDWCVPHASVSIFHSRPYGMGTGTLVGVPSGPHRPLPRLGLLRGGMTALLRAAMNAAFRDDTVHLPIIRALIHAGAALDIQDSGSDECVSTRASPFSRAGRTGWVPATRVGVPSGPHRPLPRLRLHRHAGGMTALHHAARCGHLLIVRALIRAGASLDIQDECVPTRASPFSRAGLTGWVPVRWSGYPLGHTDPSPALGCSGVG
jgi:ankyrin repeat protein